MSALEQVLKGYGCFKEGDIEGLAALCHEDMVFRMNGTHSLSGEYHGFSNWLNDFLAKIPTVIPGFHLEMEHCFESGNDVFCHLRATGEGLDAYFGHILWSRMERFEVSMPSMIPNSGPRRLESNFSKCDAAHERRR